MDEKKVGFLRGCASVSGNDELTAREALRLAAAPAEKREGLEAQALKWVAAAQLAGEALLPADRPIIDALNAAAGV